MGSLVIASLSACDQSERAVRHYEEVVLNPPTPPTSPGGMPTLPPDAMPQDTPSVVWGTPPGWIESPGQGMRLVSFRVNESDGDTECTVIVLPGDVGGLEANVSRWSGQVGVQLSPSDLKAFVASAPRLVTASGEAGYFFDFQTANPSHAPGEKSMIVAILPVPGHQVFVKLMGVPGVLVQERAAFDAVCASIRLSEEKL